MLPVVRLREAAEDMDLESLASMLHDDVEFHAPALGRLVFTGRQDVTDVFRTVFSLFDAVTCRAEVDQGLTKVLVLDCRFGRHEITDAALVEFDDQGLIRRFQPHLRPWPASSLFILRMAGRLCRDPRLLRRAASSGPR